MVARLSPNSRAVIRFPWPDADPLPALELASIAAGGSAGSLGLVQTLDSSEGCCHVDLQETGADQVDAIGRVLAARLPGATLRTMRPLLSIAGASASQHAPYHYMVETDVEAGWDKELNAWYDTEHLVGLASVPGTVSASRFVSLDEGPRYIACYDLTSLDTFNSPAWLAARSTDWSSRLWPVLRNTRRTMFRRVA